MCTKLTYVMIRIQGHALLCAFVALSMLVILQPASAGVIFFADFEDASGYNDPAQWVPDNPGQAWRIDDFPGSGKGLFNINEGCGTSGNTPLPGVDNFSDGMIQLDMSWGDDDSWGVIFRKTADDAGYIVVFGYIETPAVIVADLAKGCGGNDCLNNLGCENNPANTLIEVPHGLGANLTEDLSVSYTGRIEAKGDMIRVWFLPTADIADPLGDLGEPLVEIQDGTHTGPGSVGVWQESMSNSMIDNVMVLTLGAQPLAWAPNPKDGTLLTQTWASLSWRAGDFAVSHDVYLGDNFDNVNDGTGDTFRGNQIDTTLFVGFPGFPYPDGLVPGTNYYWRVDEVNDANAASPWMGNIWNFSIQPYTAYDPDPPDGAEFVAPDATLSWMPGFGAKLHTVYIGTDFDTVNNAAGGTPTGFTRYTPAPPLELEKVYYWRVDEFDAITTHKGDVWSFTTPGAVGNPQPANNATDVAMNATLAWTPADNAASHELYFGTDKEAVRNANTGSPEYKGSKALGAENHDPGLLEPDATYSWRVDAVYNTGTVKGLVWSFTTADFINVEDFESYTDDDAAGEAIWQTWIDGFGVPDNGAQVGYLLPPYAEQSIVHGGSQSMPLLYVNEAGVTNSEASRTLTAPRDWTQASVAELSLWFRGSSDNAVEPLYVAVSNAAGGPAVAAHEDANAAQTSRWTRWVVPLQTFADKGINLTNVAKISIGLGSKSGMVAPGGSGTMYIDDIRLYRSSQ